MSKRDSNSQHRKTGKTPALSFTRLEPRRMLAGQTLSFAQSIVQNYYFAVAELRFRAQGDQSDSTTGECPVQNDQSNNSHPDDCVSLAVTLSNFHFNLFDVQGRVATNSNRFTFRNGVDAFSSSGDSADPTQGNNNQTHNDRATPTARLDNSGYDRHSTSPQNAPVGNVPNAQSLTPISIASSMSALDAAYSSLPLDVDHQSYFLETEDNFDAQPLARFAQTGLLDQYQTFSLISLETTSTPHAMGAIQEAHPESNLNLLLERQRIAVTDVNNATKGKSGLSQMEFDVVNHAAYENNFDSQMLRNSRTESTVESSATLADANTPTLPTVNPRPQENDLDDGLAGQDAYLARIDEEIQAISAEPIPLIETAIVAAFLVTSFRKHPENDEGRPND